MTSAIGNAVKQLVNDGKIAIPISTHTEKNVDCEINKYSRKLLFIFHIITILIQKLMSKMFEKNTVHC